MAKLERPDYSFQGQVPQAAIIQAYQEKAKAEQESRDKAAAAKEQKWIDTAKIVQSGADMITKFTETAKLKAQEDAFKAAELWVGRKGEIDPTTQKAYGEDPNYNATLRAYMMKADPEGAKKEAQKALWEEAGGKKAGTLSGRDIQQKNVILKDGQRVSLNLFETTPSDKYGTAVTWTDFSGNEIDPAMLEGAVEAPAPAMQLDQFGRPHIVERVGSAGPRAVGFGTPGATPDKVATDDPENAYSRLKQKAPEYADLLDKKIDESTVKDEYIKSKVESVNASRYAKELLSDPETKETELRSVYTYIARAVEKGALTEADKAAFSEPLSVIARGENFFMKNVKGTAGKTFRNSLVRLQDRLERRGKAELKQRIETNKNVAKRRIGKAWEPGLESQFPDIEELLIQGSDMSPSGGLEIDQNALDAELKRRGL